MKLSASKWNEIETFFGADAENTTISWSVNGTELTAYNDDNCDLSFFEKWNSASKSVIVKADAEPGVYNVTMKLTDGGVKVATSTFTITVNAPTFSKRQNYWDAENNITVRVDRNGALTATLSEALVLDNADLSDNVHFVFEPTAEFEDIVTVSGTNSDVVTWVGDAEHTIPVNGYSNVEMVYYLVNASGTPVTEEMTCGVRFYNPLRTPVFTETVIDMHDAEEAEIDMTELAINMLVNDRVSGSDIPVIAESVLCDGTEGTANADTYGVKISYSSKDSRIDTETVEGKVYWKNTVSLAPGTVEEVTVTVTIENNWSVYTQDVTIRVAATK